jgi:broad specificity phosphatase PhoE
VTTVLLIRHGQHNAPPGMITGRMRGVRLSETGRAQAAALAESLAGRGIAAVYSSPLERTMETASFAAERTGLEVMPLDDLLEIDYGEWAGLTLEQLRPIPAWERWNDFRSGTRPPGGETMLEAQARAARALEMARSRHPEGTVAFFTHGDVIRAAVLYCLGAPLDLILRFEISLASVTPVELSEYGPRVLGVNLT